MMLCDFDGLVEGEQAFLQKPGDEDRKVWQIAEVKRPTVSLADVLDEYIQLVWMTLERDKSVVARIGELGRLLDAVKLASPEKDEVVLACADEEVTVGRQEYEEWQ